MPEAVDRMLQSEARLERLARRCRVLQGTVCALSLALVVLALGGADALNRFKKVELNEIILRDDAGKMRGWFGVGVDGNARLSIFDREEKEAAMLGVAPDGAVLVSLSRGDRVVTAGVDADRVPRIELAGEGKGGASLYYRPDVASGLFLRDQEGHARLQAGLAPGGAPQVLAFDANDKVRIALAGAPERSYALTFLDEREEKRLALGLNPQRTAFIDLFQHPEKATRMGMAVEENGACAFSIRDRFGKPRIALELFAQGAESLFRMDDGSGENGITMRTDQNGRVYQDVGSKVKGTAIHLGIDEQGTSRMTFSEKGTPPRLELLAKPGSQALFSARDARGKERARVGVNREGKAEMRTMGEKANENLDPIEPAQGRD